jgi:hypothetical protein
MRDRNAVAIGSERVRDRQPDTAIATGDQHRTSGCVFVCAPIHVGRR